MTDQEINEAVARKLGYKLRADGLWELNANDRHRVFDRPPDFCERIDTAWPIAEVYRLMLIPVAEGWQCRGLHQSVIASTAQMAICKTFLNLPN